MTALGLPIAIALCSEVSLFALSSLLLSPLGADVVASHQIALNTSAVAFMFPMSIAMAATILVAQELGNHAPQKAKIMAHAAIILGLIAASVLALVIWVFSAEIAALIVGDNATVIALSGGLLAMAAIYQFSDSVQVVVSGILRGYKDTKIILYITVTCLLGRRYPCWLYSFPHGLDCSKHRCKRFLGRVYHCLNHCRRFTLYTYAKNPITI